MNDTKQDPQCKQDGKEFEKRPSKQELLMAKFEDLVFTIILRTEEKKIAEVGSYTKDLRKLFTGLLELTEESVTTPVAVCGDCHKSSCAC